MRECDKVSKNGKRLYFENMRTHTRALRTSRELFYAGGELSVTYGVQRVISGKTVSRTVLNCLTEKPPLKLFEIVFELI